MGRVLPILFNTEMVVAIMRQMDPKTTTRRIIKGFIPDDAVWGYTASTPKGYISCRGTFADGYGEKFFKLPCQPEDVLYIRETWGISNLDPVDKIAYITYKASINEKDGGCKAIRFSRNKFEKMYGSMAENSPEWHPSIHMPKEAARIWLKVMDVWVERLQDITHVDIIMEGVKPEYLDAHSGEKTRNDFSKLWDSTINKSKLGIHGWDANPWVWVIEFERCEKPETQQSEKKGEST